MMDPWFYLALSYIDLDETVQLLLAQKAQHRNWPGPDFLAMAHMRARAILVHPDMQKYYVEEGKWVDFLSTRVPAYAKYRQ